MKIKNKTAIVYDIEIFPNLFMCTLKDTETKEVYVVEISDRESNISLLYDLFSNEDYIFVGYNNSHYDNVIINFLIQYRRTIEQTLDEEILSNLFGLSNLIVNDVQHEQWKKFKYAKFFDTLDLMTMLYSSKLRVSLKEMQVTMKYPNVEEYPGDFSVPILLNDIPIVQQYNLNDVESTEELLYRCEKDIELRVGIEEEFNVDVLSKDGMTIGTEILKHKYLEKSNKRWEDIKDLRSPCDKIELKDIIFPNVSFKTKQLQDLLKEMKSLTIGLNRKGFEKIIVLQDMKVVVSVGGIHGDTGCEQIIPEENEVIFDSDVNSLYPSLIISYNLVPKHLGKEFLDIYSQIREERLYAKKHGLDIKNQTYKLSLNGATGNYQNQYSWLYDPIAVLKIRINGQLFLLMLTEMLIEAGAKMKQINTDGALYVINKNVDVNTILKKWENITKLSLETDEFERFYQFAINDYVGVLKGYSETKDKKLLKKKGLFIDKVTLGKGMQPMIIPKAINNFLVDGIPIEETVYNSKDINDFLTYQKVGKQFDVYYGKDKVTHINRFYMSTNGKYLTKCYKDGSNVEKIVATSGVTIANNLNDIKKFPTKINYDYYLKEIRKITNAFTTKQLTLF